MVQQMPPVHPAADIYPLMADEELADLAHDIKARGQLHPILLTGGQILDGRNRYRACLLAEVEPVTKEWDQQGDPMEVVKSLNSRRRHLTPAQRAAVAAAITAYYEAQGRERKAEGGRNGKPGTKDRDESTLSLQDESARSVVRAARAEGAGVSATKTLKAIKEKAPEVFELARDGKVDVEDAKRLAAQPEPERKKEVTRIKRGGKPVKPARPRIRKPKEEPKPMFERLPEDLPPPPAEAPPEPVSLKTDHTAEPPVPDMWSDMQHDAEETLTGPERDGSAIRHAQQVLRLIGEVRRLVRGR